MQAAASLTAVTAVLSLLLVAAIFGRLHKQGGATVEPLGDRLISGLLAIPLISCWVKLVFPEAYILWVLAAPLPLAVYLIFLASTDNSNDIFSWTSKFNGRMFVIIGIIYVIFAVFALVSSLLSDGQF
jgi:hypothetical protein